MASCGSCTTTSPPRSFTAHRPAVPSSSWPPRTTPITRGPYANVDAALLDDLAINGVRSRQRSSPGKMVGKALRLPGGICTTTKSAAGKSMARLPTKVCKASTPPDRSTYHNNVMPSHLGLLFSCYENCCADIANLIHHVLSLAAAWRQPP